LNAPAGNWRSERLSAELSENSLAFTGGIERDD
jgi:hypothetical protein